MKPSYQQTSSPMDMNGYTLMKDSNLLWKQPRRVDAANLFAGSIMECTIDGEWDVSKERNMTFKLRNHLYIEDLVKDISNDK